MKNSFIFDYDSTLITVESFDEMIFDAIKNRENFKELKIKIERITDAGMNGEIDLSEGLKKRLEMAGITQKEIDDFSEKSLECITPGMKDIVDFLIENKQEVFILSGGFLEAIYPVADILKIPREHCFANEFLKDEEGKVVGIDFENPLSTSTGKVTTIQREKEIGNILGKVYCIGDGMSDANPYLQGVADMFLGFGQNKNRDAVREKASEFFLTTKELLEYLRSEIKEKQ